MDALRRLSQKIEARGRSPLPHGGGRIARAGRREAPGGPGTPASRERQPADPGVEIVETLAYVGDRLSYAQDAIASEAYLGTPLTFKRRALAVLALLGLVVVTGVMVSRRRQFRFWLQSRQRGRSLDRLNG